MNEWETLLCRVLDCRRADLYLERGRPPFSSKQISELQRLLSHRIAGEPLQYLMKEAYFMGHVFKVASGVLIPRPETEVLVEQTLLEIRHPRRKIKRVLDIGTGSGNIVISLALAAHVRALDFFAVDISDTCLAVARDNAKNHGVGDNITFATSDLFGCFKARGAFFDVVVSNPPYIPKARYDALPDDVRREPSLALLGGEDGLDFYRRIEEGAGGHLVSGGVLLLEIGDDQAAGVARIFSDGALWKVERVAKDLNNRDRVVVIRKVSLS